MEIWDNKTTNDILKDILYYNMFVVFHKFDQISPN